jgi:hypothetical protein
VTTVRIVFAPQSLRAARAPDGSEVPDWRLHQRLIVLADTVPTEDGGHRAVPLWLRVYGHKGLLNRVAQLGRPGQPGQPGQLGRAAADAEVASGLLETAVRLLRAAGTEVSAVDIEPASDDVPELHWDTVTARVGLATATGTRPPVTVSAEYGLALAAVAGAPVRVADTVMDRLAVPVEGEDMLAPFLPLADGRPPGRPGPRRRFWPRNMAFTDGLDYWGLAGSISDDGQPAGPGYSGTAADQSAVLAATVPEPAGSAVLVQTIYADDYHGRTVTFRGQLRTSGLAGQAGLQLAVSGPPDGPLSRPLLDHGSSPAAPGRSDWTWHEVTVPVPGEAIAIRFGIFLAGHGRVELRGAELSPAPPGTQE